MSLAAGSKLGPYEIVAPIGAGGMGEVYRARDTRLDRIVAIKILPAHLSANPEAKQRFEREARAISSLSHPNICHLYDVGAQDGLDYIVMEYLEGETLADRLQKGALPLEQLLRYGVEISEGLDKAHRSGVIHRDLKPGNIMLTRTGAKLMDFGLAKSAGVSAVNQPASALTQSLSPAAVSPTAPLTAQGSIVGTFQYMSPEQVEGKEADGRSDIFSLGTVLYEMATGKRAFEGKTAASAMAAVLERDPPPISSVQRMSPPALDLVVKTCLAKDPDQRFQSAHDVGLQLHWLAQSSQTAAPAISLPRRPGRWMAAALLIVVAIALGIGGGLWWHPAAPRGATVLAVIPAPAKARFELMGDLAGPVVVSPDGSTLAFTATDENGVRALWVRNLATGSEQALTGTTGATFPFWSPDSAALGFFAETKLKTIRLSTGEISVLTSAPDARGGAWSSEGTVLYEPETQARIWKVSVSGGTPQQVTSLQGTPYTTHRWPCFLPDGRHFLYLAATHGDPRSAQTAVFVGSLGGGAPRLLVHTLGNPEYAAGFLLFLREDNLMAQKLDLGSLTLTGDPILLVRNVLFDLSTWRGVYSSSQNRVLAYQSREAARASRLALYDRAGKLLKTINESGASGNYHVSPDGKLLAIAEGTEPSNLWIVDLNRNIRTRLTFGPGDVDISPVWSPDGKWIAFGRRKGPNRFSLYRKRSDGSGAEEEVLSAPHNGDLDAVPTSWSPDGRFLLYIEGTRGAGKIMALPLFGDGKPFAVVEDAFDKSAARFSPDGRWVAYYSVESGRYEVYVTSFPGHTGKWQVSTGLGFDPSWSGNGKELFYVNADSQLVSVDVNIHGPTFQMGASRTLLTAHVLETYASTYDVTPDGQRFLTNSNPVLQSPSLNLLVNWNPEPKK